MRKLLMFAIMATLTSSAALGQELVEAYATNVDASGEEYVYYNLTENRLATEREADFGAWDIAFQGTNVQVNGASQLMAVGYDTVTDAPADGYAEGEDGITSLPTEAESRWFDYDFTNHVVTPIPERTIVFKTRDGHWAKLHISEYYKTVFGSEPEPRMYSFKFAIQTDGSTRLN